MRQKIWVTFRKSMMSTKVGVLSNKFGSTLPVMQKNHDLQIIFQHYKHIADWAVFLQTSIYLHLNNISLIQRIQCTAITQHRIETLKSPGQS